MPSISAPSLGLSPSPSNPISGRPLLPIRPTSDDTTHSPAASSKDSQLPAKREQQQSDPISTTTTPSSPSPDSKPEGMSTSRSLEPIVIPRTRVHKSPATPTRLPHEFDHIAYMEDMETDNRRYSEAKGLEKFMPEDGITPITELDEPLRIDVESLRSLSRCHHGFADDLDAMSSHHEAEKVNIIMAMLRKVKSATDLVVITTARPFALSARPTRLGRGARPRSRERPKTPPSPVVHSRATSDDSMFDVPEKPPMAKSWLFSVRRSDEGTLRKVTV